MAVGTFTRYVVVPLKPNGLPRTPNSSDLRIHGMDTLAGACEVQAMMERLNPGKQYTILTISN
jgi:hypothetical protein